MRLKIPRYLLLIAMSASATSTFAIQSEVKTVYAVPEGNEVRIEVELSEPVKPIISVVGNPSQMIIEFPNASFYEQSQHLTLNMNGVGEVCVSPSPAHRSSTRVVIGLDSARPYAIESSGNRFVLSILPHPAKAGAAAAATTSLGTDTKINDLHPGDANQLIAAASRGPEPQVTHLPVDSVIDDPGTESQETAPRKFKVKYIAGNTVYIDGGTNSGLRAGMNLDIFDYRSSTTDGSRRNDQDAFVASVRVVGVAATSAITEVGAADREVKVGDLAELLPKDAAVASRNAQTASLSASRDLRLPAAEEKESSSAANGVVSNSLRSSEKHEIDDGTRVAGRIGLDYSSISSGGSTPGTSTQEGISIQSDMTHILGSHWNLQGYWRARINQHSQFQEPTIEESLNKTYTMQLYYDNPDSKWVAGVGRLYLPWAVSLDTIDGGYLGRKLPLGMTTGMFAGSTPDLNSWHYRPNQRIAGSFVNFQGGDYEKFHYSSTSGVALSTIGWKTDRPFAFIENEASYKGTVSVYHSLIADSLHGVSTNGLCLGPGISHSYFTAHYQPNRLVSFDLYHNYFRDVPTATTTIVGTGVVDKLLFQGISGGVHLKPTRNIAFYSTLGASEKSGDSHRSLNQMYGASWSEIAHSGLRADFHYSKFDSNFGSGNYQVFSLSRQVTNRAFWNVQVGKQDLLSQYTTNHNSIYVADSLDINLGRSSYLQSGYTYVNGATLNYRQLYVSWGFRLDKGKSSPEYIQTPGPVH